MFKIRVPDKEKNKNSVNHIAAHKVTSFVMSKGAALSTDAIALALQHNIDIVVVDGLGHPIGRFWHSKLGSTAKISKEQLEPPLNEIGLQKINYRLPKKLEKKVVFLKDLK